LVVALLAVAVPSLARAADAPLVRVASPDSSSKGPFHFRDAFLLERHIVRTAKRFQGGPDFMQPRLTYVPGTMLSEERGPNFYRTTRWFAELAEADDDRWAGAVDRAAARYRELLGKLREAQGPGSEAVIVVLDDLGELYLEGRDLVRARQLFSEALALRRGGVERRTRELVGTPATPGRVDKQLLVARLHVADLLTRVGQIDTALGSFEAARAELMEANAVANESPPYRQFAGSLFATYFLSILLERQGQWAVAEKLWNEAVEGRSSMTRFASYWTALEEQAAFYARSGDLHRAAAVAARVLARPRSLVRELAMPYPDVRQRTEYYADPQSIYDQEGDVAMHEIVAVDRWQTEGADAAAALLEDPLRPFSFWFDHGADPDRAELLAWEARRVFLHLAILLDGQPSPDRVAKAYSLLSEVKGRYLASTAELRAAESQRGTPNAYGSLDLLDKLAQERAQRAHLFLSSVLDGKALDASAYAESVARDRAYQESLMARQYAHAVFSLENLTHALPADGSLVDTIVWDRMDRAPFKPAHRDYGAFVVRPGQGVRYVRIGEAATVEAAVGATTSRFIADHARGAELVDGAPRASEAAPSLQRLYRDVFAPLEPALAGARSMFIVADGKLALAPFAALVDGDGHALLERYAIAYLSSWRDFNSPVVRAHGPTSPPVIVGNPAFDAVLPGPPAAPGAPRAFHFKTLPQAEDEAKAIAETLGVPSDRRLLGAAAREDQLRALIGPEVLHLATHSVPYLPVRAPIAAAPTLFELPVADHDPFLESFVALAGANRPQGGSDDGLLTGLEAAGLHLSGTRLVVLSSCESAQGVAIDGQGVLGLRAGFSIAGAGAVVMNLWPVDDEASDQFMKAFYAHRDVGPTEALRLAQLELKASRRFSNPLFWGGYVVSTSPGATWRPARGAPSAPALATPACFEMSTRPVDDWFWSIRARWSGSVVQRERAADHAVYEVVPPAGDLEYRSTILRPNGQTFPGDEYDVGSYQCVFKGEGADCRTVTITVRKTAGASSLRIDGGKPARFSIVLQGGPNLFPTLDLPITLPPASAYTETRAAFAGDLTKRPIDKVGFCAP
jgi:CHAT domain-containing protein/tetratricopeptide (TPR) repeat protein